MMAMTSTNDPLANENSSHPTAEMDSSSSTTGSGVANYQGADENRDNKSSTAQDGGSLYPNTFISSGFSYGYRRRNPLPPGLSALIQAATSQLGQLADVASSRPNADLSEVEYNNKSFSTVTTPAVISTGSDRSSSGRVVSNMGENQSQQHQQSVLQNAEKHCDKEKTPLMVPESDPSKLSFPHVLMTLAIEPANADVITFLPDGKFFAIRQRKFAEDLMIRHFDPPIRTYDEFLDIVTEWGFSNILDPLVCNGISVFRHPNFIKSNWEKCSCIKFGESRTKLRLHALPDMSRIEFTVSDDSMVNSAEQALHNTHNNNCTINNTTAALHESKNASDSGTHTKRRLSPGFMARRDSASSVSSQKQKVEPAITNNDPISGIGSNGGICQTHTHESGDESELGGGEDHGVVPVPSGSASYSKPPSYADSVRSLALAITTEKLNLRHSSGSTKSSFRDSQSYSVDPLHENENENSLSDTDTPLIDRAVTSATQMIVTDAIASLLRDESHTKETYLKHEKELSTSTLPGVIPISKQLFCPFSTRNTEAIRTVARPEGVAFAASTKGFSKGVPPSEVAVPCSNIRSSGIPVISYQQNVDVLPTDLMGKQLAHPVKEFGQRLSVPGPSTFQSSVHQVVSSGASTSSPATEHQSEKSSVGTATDRIHSNQQTAAVTSATTTSVVT